MLKIRLMGTKSDIRWFQNFLQIDSDIEVLELSDIYPNKGTDRYYRSYAEVERKDGNAGRPTENGKSNRKKQIKAPVPPIKAKYPIMDWKNLPYASKLDGDQMNEILLGLEEGLIDEQVKSYFKLPADQMKQYRREQLEKE